MYVLMLILPLTSVFQLQKNALLTLCSDRILQDIVSPASSTLSLSVNSKNLSAF